VGFGFSVLGLPTTRERWTSNGEGTEFFRRKRRAEEEALGEVASARTQDIPLHLDRFQVSESALNVRRQAPAPLRIHASRITDHQ